MALGRADGLSGESGVTSAQEMLDELRPSGWRRAFRRASCPGVLAMVYERTGVTLNSGAER